jgi:ribosome-associated translation inhibitor RaiA
MDIELRVRGGRRADWLPLLRARLMLALRRFGSWLSRVRVNLDDVNGPRGGQDKRCTLLLATRDGRQLRIAEQTDDWKTAFASALDRAAQQLRKLHERASAHRHPSTHGVFDDAQLSR